MENKIKEIQILNDSANIKYTVGVDGVTEILETQYSPEPYCAKSYWEIFRGEKLSMKIYSATLVTYF
jgi:hypothetical protein